MQRPAPAATAAALSEALRRRCGTKTVISLLILVCAAMISVEHMQWGFLGPSAHSGHESKRHLQAAAQPQQHTDPGTPHASHVDPYSTGGGRRGEYTGRTLEVAAQRYTVTGFVDRISATVEELIEWSQYSKYILDREGNEEYLKKFNSGSPQALALEGNVKTEADKVSWHASPTKQYLFNEYKDRLPKQEMVHISWTGERGAQSLKDFVQIANPAGLLFSYTNEPFMGQNGYAQEDDEEVHWYVNAADPDAFYSANSGMVTQDEWLVFEHPELEGLRELFLAMNKQANKPKNTHAIKGCTYRVWQSVRGWSQSLDEPTTKTWTKNTSSEWRKENLEPCYNFLGEGAMLLQHVPRLFQIDAFALGIYGYELPKKEKQAREEPGTAEFKLDTEANARNGNFKVVVDEADQPAGQTYQYENILKMAAVDLMTEEAQAEALEQMYYQAEWITRMFNTAHNAFALVKLRQTKYEKRSVIHTVNWGAGAFYHNRYVTAMIQIIAAKTAGIQKLMYHDVDRAGVMGHDNFVQLAAHVQEFFFVGAGAGGGGASASLLELTQAQFVDKIHEFVGMKIRIKNGWPGPKTDQTVEESQSIPQWGLSISTEDAMEKGVYSPWTPFARASARLQKDPGAHLG